MKKVLKVLSLMTVPMVFAAAVAGCGGKKVENQVEIADMMADIDLAPDQTAVYEAYSKQALADYKAVANAHLNEDGEVDTENAEVIAAANIAAAKMFAYACYNERYLNQYVYFSNKDGETDLGSVTGSADATTQDYYLRINEQFDENNELITCGYRYHYNIKKVNKSTGSLKNLGLDSLFEGAKIRYTVNTNILYRFKADMDTVYDKGAHPTMDVNILACQWETDSDDWAKPDVEMKKGEYIAPEDIRADIEAHAGEDNITMRANINILADGIVKNAMISEEDEGGLLVVMAINTEVANGDEASLKMLRKANGSSNCKWQDIDDESGLTIVYRLWDNGMLRMYACSERWSGKISGFSGEADTTTITYYSYSDRDCDMTGYLEMLQEGIDKVEK